MKLHVMASIPVILALLLAGFVGMLFLEILAGKRRHISLVYRIGSGLYLVIYVWLTFFSRTPAASARIRLEPFWSLRHMYTEKGISLTVVREMLLNVLLYIPVGSLLSGSLRDTAHARRNTFLAGACLTVLTELLQYLLRLGLAETDDLIHNLLGLFLGMAAYWVAVHTARALAGETEHTKE